MNEDKIDCLCDDLKNSMLDLLENGNSYDGQMNVGGCITSILDAILELSEGK